MTFDRRGFLHRAAVGAAGLSVLPAAAGMADEKKEQREQKPPRNRIAVSTYSFWHFRDEKVPIEACIDKAAAMGFDGVEILHVQMSDESNG
jgi:hypothetical protein